jgi:RNA polymerase sigma factor (sigma-70 family)
MAVVTSERLREGGHGPLDAAPDEQLVSLVRSGHEAAFAVIVRRYERELKTHARRLTSDGGGEDAVQQAFLNAFAALQSGHEVRHLRGWLHQILRNEASRARLPLEAPLDAAAVSGETLEDTVQRRATAHATLAQLSALPERQRDALLRTAVFGLPRAHVARTMGLSEGAVRQLVHRARVRLRQAANAFIPFPLLRLLGAARSGVDGAPDAALGAGTAASGGLAIKVGALLASGAVATGIAVTHTFPARHSATLRHDTRHHPSDTRAARSGAPAPAPPVASSGAASATTRVALGGAGTPETGTDGRSHGGPGRVFGTRSGRGGKPGSGRGTDDAGRRDDGSEGSGNRGSGHSGGDGSVLRTAAGPGSGPGGDASVDGGGSGGGGDGSGSGSRDGGSGSGSGSSSATSSGASAGSGSDDGGASGDGLSGGTVPSGSTGSSGSGSTSSVPSNAATSDGGGTSGGDGGRDGGSGGGSGQAGSGESRDVSGSLRSSSS